MNRYAQRDRVLNEMGFASYRDYLASPLWQRIRARMLKACPTCPCGKPAEQIHHRTYKRRYLEGRGLIHKYLVPICRTCHEAIEFEGSEKLSLGWANAKLDEIREVAESRGFVIQNKYKLKRSKTRVPAILEA